MADNVSHGSHGSHHGGKKHGKDAGHTDKAVITATEEIETTDVADDPIRGHGETGQGRRGTPAIAQSATVDRDATIFANSLIKSFLVYKKLFRIFLRFPFNIVKDDRRLLFVFRWKACVAIGFAVTSILVAIQLLLFCFNVVAVLLNLPPLHKGFHYTLNYYNYSTAKVNETKGAAPVVYKMSGTELRACEMYFFHRNLVPVLVIMCSLMTSTVANLLVFTRRRFLCDYYSFWTTAVELMRIDAAYGVARTMKIVCFIFVFSIVLLIIFAVAGFAPITFGTQTISTYMTARICYFDSSCYGVFFFKYFWVAGIFHGFFAIYVFINSKSTILLFLWTCRLLIMLFRKWNMRLDSVLHNRAVAEKDRATKVANRTGYDHLFKDHVCILDLMEGCDTLFGQIIEGYYTTTIASFCFELFYIIRALSEPMEFVGGRKYDAVVMGVYCAQNLFILFMVTWSAANISDEALIGLDIVRRKGTMGKSRAADGKEKENATELYFVNTSQMLSMYISYSGHFDSALTLGGYFVIDKAFLVGLFGTIVSYFIIVIQFTPPLIMKNSQQLNEIQDTKSLIQTTEWNWNHRELGQTYPERQKQIVTASLKFYALSSSPGQEDYGGIIDKWDFDHDFEFLDFLNTNSQNFTGSYR